MVAPTGMEDRVGLERAYKAEVGLYDAGDTLYIAGTRDLGDWYDDLKIPFQATNKSWREREASMVLDANPQLTRVVVIVLEELSRSTSKSATPHCTL